MHELPRDPALDHLDALVGAWTTEATHPLLPASTPGWLAPAAAFVLAATAALALAVHAVRAEWSLVPINLVLIAVALVVAARRWKGISP